MYYCIYNINSGAIQQWLNSSINPNIPIPNIEVTQQEFENQTSYQYVINGTTLSLTPPTIYYVDNYGVKYSVQLQPTYQSLQCNFNDLILYENNQWIVATTLQQSIYNTKISNATSINNFLNNGYYYSPSLLTFLNFSVLAIDNINNLLKINNSSSNSISLRLLNNTFINVTYAELQNIYNEMLNFKMNLYNEKWNLENLINIETSLPSWQANTVYNLNQEILDPNGNIEKVIQAGTSSNTTPAFNTQYLSTTNDNTIIWKNLLTPINTILNYRQIDINKLLNTSQWQPNFNYSNYQYIIVFNSADYSYTLYKCLQNGTSGSVLPNFNNTLSSITTDNNISWLCLGEQLIYLTNIINNFYV